MEPWRDNQYGPLKLLSKEAKAKRTLTVEQIFRAAEQFGVTYEEAIGGGKAARLSGAC